MPNYQTYFAWVPHCVIIIVLISQNRPCHCKELFSEELDVLIPLYVRRTYLENHQIHFRNPNYTEFVDPGIVNINIVFKGSTEILQEMIGHKVIEWIFTKSNSVKKMPTFTEVKIDYFSGESQHKGWKFDTQCITLNHCTMVEATFYELATLNLLCLENMYACKTV